MQLPLQQLEKAVKVRSSCPRRYQSARQPKDRDEVQGDRQLREVEARVTGQEDEAWTNNCITRIVSKQCSHVSLNNCFIQQQKFQSQLGSLRVKTICTLLSIKTLNSVPNCNSVFIVFI
uniref:Uncharacterized protein n=1 Tax=Micrurus lemniscatus lemniscatus TaxID=129467 RepID=A0A2D4IG86_MICLE